ncbi:RnfABCDGE type electron transport complex subunit D [Flammeovirga yaeyamensis]|uniref:Ion-translocating oxidoreductase complex subunit D n=1 Tax=Flammeovirga yaeyamensis TaxID=367791 RepID=A0AAX1NDQ7_9BACT|nr:RnfABCDGE type electron transport complex subunit D [Flammeovirga yaeyamensis]MBB3701371.1 electron transport complex protein RnfD [Flammeovirga yaeyamensis]NMF38561.1 RnfABCDGE type electron transport complex subunit D [Flammeovirga yaeyamensis]QWG04475.1 RnfABCDGE type electron transport complex subunit D [Flammeovirga yaeyamensis]
MRNQTLNISTSPHLKKGVTTDVIMKNVVYALIPATAFSIYVFGLSALLTIGMSVTSCLLTEHFLCKWSGKASTINDYSAVITGVLLGLTLPPIFPLWMTFMGGVIAIGLGKYLFGGLGYNVFNPALVGRAVLQAAFPVAITTWYPALMSDRFTSVASSLYTLPFMQPFFDGQSGATPLSAFKFDHISAETTDLVFGFVSGSTGETCTIAIVLGGLYLIYRGMMNWKIPVSIIASAFLFSGMLYLYNPELYPTPWFIVFSGGLMLGAFFMATDMVGSPITNLGVIIYGSFIGILVVIIRIWGGLPEGVMYAILLGNALAPQLDRVIQPRVYGTSKLSKS